MRIGFTGTRRGMSTTQAAQLAFILGTIGRGLTLGQEFHYGTHAKARLLADEQARSYAEKFGYVPVPHHAKQGDELARDRVLVAAIDILIAAPLTNREELRSGTWATVRYMRDLGRPVVMLSRGK